MPSGGRLLIETSNQSIDDALARVQTGMPPGEYVRVTVTDTGHGMSDHVKAHLFEPFFTTKEKGKGTGLGLATCSGVAKQSGGYIQLEGEPGRGTPFHVFLPRVQDKVDNVPESMNVSAEMPGGHEHVLLVEDDDGVREMIGTVLRRLGFLVSVCSGGAEEMRLVQSAREPFDLLLTDVGMPGMNGRELADRLRAFQPGLKVLFTSGHTEDAILHHGVLREGVSFLQKPFNAVVLAHKARATLDHHQTGVP